MVVAASSHTVYASSGPTSTTQCERESGFARASAAQEAMLAPIRNMPSPVTRPWTARRPRMRRPAGDPPGGPGGPAGDPARGAGGSAGSGGRAAARSAGCRRAGSPSLTSGGTSPLDGNTCRSPAKVAESGGTGAVPAAVPPPSVSRRRFRARNIATTTTAASRVRTSRDGLRRCELRLRCGARKSISPRWRSSLPGLGLPGHSNLTGDYAITLVRAERAADARPRGLSHAGL